MYLRLVACDKGKASWSLRHLNRSSSTFLPFLCLRWRDLIWIPYMWNKRVHPNPEDIPGSPHIPRHNLYWTHCPDMKVWNFCCSCQQNLSPKSTPITCWKFLKAENFFREDNIESNQDCWSLKVDYLYASLL